MNVKSRSTILVLVVWVAYSVLMPLSLLSAEEQAAKESAGTTTEKTAPAEKETKEKVNVFPQGLFDTAILEGNLPKEWSPMDLSKISLEQEGKDRYLRIVNDKPDARVYALARIAVKPEWKRLSLSTRMAGKNLKSGVGDNKKAGFAISFENVKKERIGGGGYNLFLKADTEWKPMGDELVIPAGTAFIALRVGLHCYTGELGIDDIHISVQEEK